VKKRFRVTADLVTERELTVMEMSYALTMMLEGWPVNKSNELEIERLTVLERPCCTAAPLVGQRPAREGGEPQGI
jgi:hypothetical protein